MTETEAIRIIVTNYMKKFDISPTQFARRCDVGSSFITKLLNPDYNYGKRGIYYANIQKLAYGMNLEPNDFQDQIKNLQKTNDTTVKIEYTKEEIEKEIDYLQNNIIQEIKKMEELKNILKNMD